MKLSRIFQPRNPTFWIMVALNFLSMVLSHISQTFALNTFGFVVVISLAILNALASTFLAWRLVNS